jgi:hypothetical protein
MMGLRDAHLVLAVSAANDNKTDPAQVYQVQNPGVTKAPVAAEHWTARDFRGHHLKSRGIKAGHDRRQRNRQ